MLKLKLSILFLLFLSTSFSQSTDASNYVVLESGDTLKGKIQRVKKTKRGVKFLKKLHYWSTDGDKSKISYDEISGYTINDEVFRKYNLEQVSNLRLIKNYYRFVPYGGEQVFLNVWLEGPLSHYEYEWIDGNSDNISRFPLLKTEDNEMLVKVSQGLFGMRKKDLVSYFDSCPALQDKISIGELDSAQEIVQYYYQECLQ